MCTVVGGDYHAPPFIFHYVISFPRNLYLSFTSMFIMQSLDEPERQIIHFFAYDCLADVMPSPKVHTMPKLYQMYGSINDGRFLSGV